ncbi:hypothetical protein ACJIZ3_010971 [Penstemon smallii]|uniref:Uncharacterized protein n=1 Tax=Penstemon smallii TaxID=265156 RepID=A0ABD3UHU2_9LAMI
MPNTLALIAVHRHTAASRSTKFPISEQHGVVGGVPTTSCTKSFNKLAHTPNFKVSIEHVAGEGTFLPQLFRSRLSESGTLRLMPNTLALIAVHRHTAASRSTKFPISEQHGVVGGVPITSCTKSFNKLAHTPNFKVSIEHVAGGRGKEVELAIVKNIMLRRRKRTAREAIFSKDLNGCICEVKEMLVGVIKLWSELGYL